MQFFVDDRKELQSMETRTLSLLGCAYMRANRWSDAIACFKSLIEQDRYCAPAFICRGLAYKEIGDMDNYEEDFSAAVSLQPELMNHRKYGAEFARIKKEDEEDDAKWDAAFRLPESETLLSNMADEALNAHHRGETEPLKSVSTPAFVSSAQSAC